LLHSLQLDGVATRSRETDEHAKGKTASAKHIESGLDLKQQA